MFEAETKSISHAVLAMVVFSLYIRFYIKSFGEIFCEKVWAFYAENLVQRFKNAHSDSLVILKTDLLNRISKMPSFCLHDSKQSPICWNSHLKYSG